MNSFVELIRRSNGSPPLGVFLASASPLVAEALGCCGFAWGIVDAEHSPLGIAEIAHMLQAIGTTPMQPVVRIPWNDTVTVKRVLDAGASNLLFPFVQNGEEARRAVAATRYPPEGVRGMSTLSRGSRFGATPDYFRTANSNIGVVVQIESAEALENLEAIASVPGVDGIFIGPTDLSGSLGFHGDGGHPQVQKMLMEAAARCNNLGMPVATVARNVEAAEQYARSGFNFLVLSSDLGLLLGQAKAALGRWAERKT